MRADRLLAIVMLLQKNGRMTARELAEELEVSARTIYRDIVALSGAGIPVYTEHGPGGGVSLVESYRTDLTGLNREEVSALAMLTIPAPLVQLGVEQELKAALLKLSAALPDASREAEKRVRQRIYLDASWWFQSEEPVPHLQTIYRALWAGRWLRLAFRDFYQVEVPLVLAPYGLVAKANVWYLVGAAGERVRTLRVSSITQAVLLEKPAGYPPDFDLAAYWKSWSEGYERQRPFYPVTARISPDLAANLHFIFGERAPAILAQAGPPDEQGWVQASLPFESLEAARTRLLGVGRAVEVLEPRALRMSLVDFAQQVVDFYAGR